MTGPLDVIDRRLAWAWDQIEDVETIIRGLLSGKPLYEITTEPQADGVTDILRAHAMRPIPPDLGFMVGDAIHNLRACLDNIAYGLVGCYRQPSWGTAFPICKTAGRFQRKALPKLTGIPQGAIDIIEGVQPYHDGDWTLHWLRLLDDRWNRDKHRSPTVVGSIPGHISYLAHDGDVADFVVFVDRGIEDGMEMGYVRYISPQHTRRDPHLAFQIVVEEADIPPQYRALPTLLQTEHHLIRDEVLNPLRPFFVELT